VPPTVLEVLRKATAWFAERGFDTPRLDAEVLIAHGLSLRRLDLYLQHDRPLREAELSALRALVAERARGVPVAYLTGEREFYALPFHVGPDVLVPRPETEGLVDAAVAALCDLAAPRFADVGTGSGCVAVAVLRHVPAASAIATDRSSPALAVAARNAERHGVSARLSLRAGHLLEPLRGDPAFGALDAVLSNPPYVVRGDPTLAPDVAAHEPEGALYVEGTDPLAVARELAAAAREALAPGGLLAMEVGAGSGAAAAAMLSALGYGAVGVAADGAGIPRVVSGRTPGAER
jgi:release factor glutamine methyltransferase